LIPSESPIALAFSPIPEGTIVSCIAGTMLECRVVIYRESVEATACFLLVAVAGKIAVTLWHCCTRDASIAVALSVIFEASILETVGLLID